VTDTVTNGLSLPDNLLHNNNARFAANTVFCSFNTIQPFSLLCIANRNLFALCRMPLFPFYLERLKTAEAIVLKFCTQVEWGKQPADVHGQCHVISFF